MRRISRVCRHLGLWTLPARADKRRVRLRRVPPAGVGQNRMPRVVAPTYAERRLRRNASARCVLLPTLTTQDEQMSRATQRILGRYVASVDGSRAQPPGVTKPQR